MSLWPELVRQKFNSGDATYFTIFTGTHGNLGGQFLNNQGQIEDRYKDDSHTAEDRKSARTLMIELNNCNIRVIDIFTDGGGSLRKPDELKIAAQREIAADRIVIFAWCYSMEAFKQVPGNVVAGQGQVNVGQQSEFDYVTARSTTAMRDIVLDVFGGDLSGYQRP